MKLNLIRIGNSKGIRINANIIKECELESEVEIKVVNKKIIIQAVKEARSGWNKSFEDMHKNIEDTPLITDGNTFDKDWEW